MESIIRIVVLALCASSAWKAFTQPHVSSTSERLPLTIMGRFAISFAPYLKRAYALSCFFESAFILASLLFPTIPSPLVASALCRTSLRGQEHIAITPAFIIGSTLLLTGAYIRITCFRILGKFFTFEMSIRKDHTLITTGPYAIVRHPAYTGLIMALCGLVIVQFEGGSWLSQCGWLKTTLGRACQYFLISSVLFISLGTIKRGWNEDKALQDKFGDAWVEWTKATPYRMFPLVY